jgi:type VI protein secretion system component Hcp
MTRFRPSVESLDARALPSAVLAAQADDYLHITMSDVLVSSFSLAAPDDATTAPEQPTAGESGDAAAKVTFQDFHFVARMSKSSPILH